MQTIRLFKEDVYKKEASAKVTSVAERDGKTIVTIGMTLVSAAILAERLSFG